MHYNREVYKFKTKNLDIVVVSKRKRNEEREIR